MKDQSIPKEPRLTARASAEFISSLDQYVKQNNLNKSDFIRTAIINEMQRKESDPVSTMLSDNAFFNYVLAESATSPKCKELIKNFKGGKK